MPSIFIWKASAPSTSKKQIRYYSGSNWILEDNEFSSKSYMFLDQIVIPGFNDSVITYHAKLMPQDWIGSDLLEVSQVLYEQIKSDNYGSLERIGDWMRLILKKDIDFEEESLMTEVKYIEKWMTTKQQSDNKQNQKQYQKPNQNKYSQKHQINHQNVEHNFQEFLNKYTMTLPTNTSDLSTSNKLIINNINQLNSYNNIGSDKYNKYKSNCTYIKNK